MKTILIVIESYPNSEDASAQEYSFLVTDSWISLLLDSDSSGQNKSVAQEGDPATTAAISAPADR